MSIFDVNGYTHTFDGIRHTWTKPGAAMLSVRTSGADLVPRGATVERTRRRRYLPYALTGWGEVTNGNAPGGQGITLNPAWQADTLAALDGTIERHNVCAFTESGELLTRERLGYGFEYTPVNDPPQVQRIPALSGPLPSSGPALGWQRIDPAHLIRAFGPAVAAWRERRDPIAFWDLQRNANDAMLHYADQKVGAGDGFRWSLAQIAENAATTHKGSAQFGEIRAHAWSLRAVVEAYRARLQEWPKEFEEPLAQWIRTFVRTVHDIQAPNGALACNDIGSGQEQGQPWFVEQAEWTSTYENQVPQGQSAGLLSARETELPSWQMPFMLRALYEAHVVLADAEVTAMVKDIVRKWMRVWRTCERIPGEYGGVGLPKYIVVSRDGALMPTLSEGIGAGITEYDGDSFEVARALGVRV